jgi:cysteinyl-tRNA synthetase
MLKLYNSLRRKKEVFKPLKNKKVGLYTCGPTCYWFAHIGNLRAYIFEDILKRVLIYNGYKVKHVMNITDVGHLVSDQDVGEDKILVAAKKERKSAKEIARFYEKAFKRDLKKLNILEPDVWIRATETINDQIELIKILEKKGFTYLIEDGVYFDTSKLKKYGRLWPKKMKILPGARVEMAPQKKNPTDFALWKFAKGRKEMVWDSPWGQGFPGWHTECVVMSMKELGIPFDIHCGGIDHILIHHTNEIAQGEAAFSKILANYWLHGEFLLVEGKKMAKSLGNIYTLDDLIKKGFNPLAFRYLCLGTHYRSKLNFTFEAIKSAQNALENFYEKVRELKSKTEPGEAGRGGRGGEASATIKNQKSKLKSEARNYQKEFLRLINDDLDIPKALALMWNLISGNKIDDRQKYLLLLDFDRVFGLKLKEIKKLRIPKKIKELVKIREEYRKRGDFKRADEIREKIKEMGYWVEDTKEGPKIKKL